MSKFSDIMATTFTKGNVYFYDRYIIFYWLLFVQKKNKKWDFGQKQSKKQAINFTKYYEFSLDKSEILDKNWANSQILRRIFSQNVTFIPETEQILKYYGDYFQDKSEILDRKWANSQILWRLFSQNVTFIFMIGTSSSIGYFLFKKE